MSTRLSFGRIYGAPSALAVLNGIGLISALLADGFWDGVSWVALSATVAVIVWFVLRKEIPMKEIKPMEREAASLDLNIKKENS